LLAEQQLNSQAAFVHLPLAPGQAAKQSGMLASMSTPLAAAGIAAMLKAFAEDAAVNR